MTEQQFNKIALMNVQGYDLFSIQIEMMFMGNQLNYRLINKVINFNNFERRGANTDRQVHKIGA